MKNFLRKMLSLSFSRRRESNIQEKTMDYPGKPDNDKTCSLANPGNRIRNGIITVTISFGIMLILSALNANAIGISVRPSELRIQAQTGETASARIKVKNPSEEVALFEVYPEEFENKINASPAKFTLESGEEKDVVIKFKSGEDGIFSTSLAVVARPLDNPEGIGSGAKIAFQAENKPRPIGLALISEIISTQKLMGLTILLAIMVGLAMFFRKQNHTSDTKTEPNQTGPK